MAAVPRGARVAAKAVRSKKRRARQPIGRGQYVKAPLLRDKLASPRWQANAVINNPGTVLAGGGIAGGGGYLVGRNRRVEKAAGASHDDRTKEAVAGAAVGGGAAHFTRKGADYGTKALAERQFRPLTTKGNYGPYREGPHKPVLNKYKRTVKGDVRTKARMFDENFPKGIPSYRARKVGMMLNKKPVAAGIVAGGAALGAGAAAAKKRVSKARLMSDAEIRRRKKLQGHISETTSTLGLTGLGITGAAALAAKKPGVLRAVKKVPGLKTATPAKMKNTAINTGIVSGGIGGVGGYNFASYTNAESRKRKTMVTKRDEGIEMSYFGEEGSPVELPEIRVPVSKEWSPVASNFSSEGSRKKRADRYQAGALVGAGAGAAYGASHGRKAIGEARQIKSVKAAQRVSAKTKGGQIVSRVGKPFTAIDVAPLKGAAKHGGKAALGAAAVGAGIAAHQAIGRRKTGSWQSYAKRGGETISAFGVDHGETVSATAVSKSVLSAEGREKIKSKNFVYPGSKSYPIHDRAHARNALARAAQSKTKGSYEKVAAKVHRRFPDIGRGS